MRQLQPCGTWAAYHRHLRYHQPPCEPCREAARAYRDRRDSVKRCETATDRLIRDLVHVLACALGVGRTA